MTISAENLGLRYTNEFVFKNLNYKFESGKIYAILGPNGSGKSSLMKVLSGYVSPVKGHLLFEKNNERIQSEEIYKEIAFEAPYIELIEEFTLSEHLAFHSNFKSFVNDLSVDDILDLAELQQHAHKAVSNFSSGMKQRLKLSLAILSNAEVLLLDEPATNLDSNGVAWYHNLLKDYARNKIVIIASNRQDEYEMADEHLNIEDFK